MISRFDWDDGNIDHIARHGVIPEEAEEAFEGRHYLFKAWSGRYIVLGRTASGRHLMCVFERTAAAGEVRVITARDMDDKERKLFQRKVR